MKLETVLYEVSDGVATITLNRPEAMNAWTPQLSDELSLAMGAADADDGNAAGGGDLAARKCGASSAINSSRV